jgi:ketosteroid isomerase-like protein
LGPQDVVAAYEARINSRDFDQLVPLISEAAVFWFNDGSFAGLEAIRGAFDKTWALAVDERYWLEEKTWVASGEDAASCIYRFRWTAIIEGKPASGGGRGTTVLRKEGDRWKIVHEHLSREPD